MGDAFNYGDYKKRAEAINAMFKKPDMSPVEMDALFDEAMSKCDAMLKFLMEKKRKATDISV